MEIDAYRHHLEQVYRLCHRCNLALQQEIKRQNEQHQLEEKVAEFYENSCNRSRRDYSDNEDEETTLHQVAAISEHYLFIKIVSRISKI